MSFCRTALLAEISLLAMVSLTTGAAGQIRREPPGDTVSPDTRRIEAALFGPDGYFLIAGGVVLHGSARFMQEQDGREVSLPTSAVIPVAEPGGRVALQQGAQTYQLAMPEGLACPLSRFIQRDGLIAFTVVKFMNDASPRALLRAGLVRRRLAREFDGTRYEKLLHAADFAATEPLPSGAAIAASLNAQNGSGAFVLRAADVADTPVGSYVNSDLQVTYRAYLMPGRVEIAGVPLRYYWVLDNQGSPAVFSVEALSQSWPANAHLTDWTAPNASPTQYDVVNFYQVAGVLRQLSLSSPAAFARFAADVCRA